MFADPAMGPCGSPHFARVLAAQSMLDTARGLTDDGILRGELREGWIMDGSRLDHLEGRVEEQSRNWERLFADVGRVDRKIDALGIAVSARIDRVDQKVDALGIAVSARIDRVDQKVDALGIALSARIDQVDLKIDALGIALSARIDQVDLKIDALGVALSARIDQVDLKIDGGIAGLRGELATQFHWTIGIMTALFTAVLAAILTR